MTDTEYIMLAFFCLVAAQAVRISNLNWKLTKISERVNKLEERAQRVGVCDCSPDDFKPLDTEEW